MKKQNKDKQIRKLGEDRDFYKRYFNDWGYYVIGCFVLLGILIFVGLLCHSQIQDLEQELQSCQDNGGLNSTLYFDNLNENCGSSFVTKRYGDDKYHVFVNDCKEDGYCKSKYVSLKECEVIE